MIGIAGSVIGTMLCLVLVGSAVLVRRRRGEPVERNALIWMAVFATAFALAAMIDRHR